MSLIHAGVGSGAAAVVVVRASACCVLALPPGLCVCPGAGRKGVSGGMQRVSRQCTSSHPTAADTFTKTSTVLILLPSYFFLIDLALS